MEVKMKGHRQESLHAMVYSSFVVVVLLLMARVGDAVILSGHRKVVAGGGGLEMSTTVPKSYAVVFDAGSSGSRVHVYCLDEDLDLLPIGDGIELYVQTRPGLSSYANDPQAAADSLIPLLEKAKSVIPPEVRSKTPLKLGATAGLRALGSETSDKILQAVKDLFQKSSLKYKPEWISVIDGTDEGAFGWVTVNYLLGNLGNEYSNTVAAVDLGGRSVQMAYAISEKDAANAPRNSDGEDTYVKELFVRGAKYSLYVHSYMDYGLMAARAQILKAGSQSYSYCIFDGYRGSYTYSGVEYEVSASPSGSSFTKCRRDAVTTLKVDEPCTYMNCTFNGVWNGGGGDGSKNLFLGASFYSRAAQATPADFKKAARSVCKLNIEEVKTMYPLGEEEDLPYLCMDLVYQYTLLVDGFGVKRRQEVTLVNQMKYGDYLVEVAWPLGSALQLVSSDDALQVRGPLYLS